MTVRICPKCNSILGSFDNFFCSSCGSPLEGGNVKEPSDFIRVVTVDGEKKKNRQEKEFTSAAPKVSHTKEIKKATFIVGFVILIGLPLIWALTKIKTFNFQFNLFKPSPDISSLTQTQIKKVDTSVSNQNILKLNTQYKSGEFNLEPIANYVPYYIDIYFESYDFGSTATQYLEFDKSVFELVDSLKPLIKPHFAAFSKSQVKGYNWTLIFLIQDDKKDLEDLELPKSSVLAIERMGEILVVSNDPSIITEVKEAKEKTVRNLTLNPQFVLARSKTPKSGQIFIAALTKGGQDYLYQLAQQNLPEDFKKILDGFVKLGQDGAVVL